MENNTYREVKKRLREMDIEDLPNDKQKLNLSIEYENLLSEILYEMKTLNRGQRIIKGILVFFCVLTIIGLILEIIFGIYIFSTIADVFN